MQVAATNNHVWCAALSIMLALLLTACGTVTGAKQGNKSSGGWSGAIRGAGAYPEQESVKKTPASLRSEKATAELKAQVYEALARVSRAGAGGKERDAEAALDAAMLGIRQLMEDPEAFDESEVQELYRSVVTAYEHYYGVADTLVTEYGDVFAFRNEAFSTLNRVREPLLEDVMLPELDHVAGAIPLETNRLVEQSIQFLLRSPEKHLYRWISRAGAYFPMIETILQEEGVPDEMKYLAMIESGLNPRARSRVGAGGMWQFMPATGKEYGLQISHWIDERSDPEKATRAAARHLRDLYGTFGDWELAMAAYNCGAGRVGREVKKFEAQAGRKATFWDIYANLPAETRNYVPMFTATALVVSNREAFNLKDVKPGPRYIYDVARVEGMLDLQTAAELSGTDVETLRALNPEIRQWTTPPSNAPYHLRIPHNTRERFKAAYAALPEDRRGGMGPYRVRRGDSLSKIARRYNTSAATLQELNGLRGTTIQEGQTLYVPLLRGEYGGAALASGADRVEYKAAPVRNAAASAVSDRPPLAVAPVVTESSTRVRYRVRRGDNLTEIARKYGVAVRQLRNWNGLSNDHIEVGQTLTIHPGNASQVAHSPRPAKKSFYRVKVGDTLTEIANSYGVSVSDLRRWNSLKNDRILVGSRLAIFTD